ncbi:hypothetical protein [Aquimarina sp. AU58]|uniref:hypothetical protein n=1 Tax=Aquimarina sp. AU58 TaxID=1874112 RepID=UPI000D6549D1|nr:hypothetical protein [Aquimarina sp. AU58]
MVYLNKNQEKYCKRILSKILNDNKLPFPKRIKLNEVNASKYYEYANRGCKELKFKIKELDKEVIIDYYLMTDHYTRHGRINELGENIELENYEGQFGLPIYENEENTKKEHKRIRDHNEKVYEVLKSKGFEP